MTFIIIGIAIRFLSHSLCCSPVLLSSFSKENYNINCVYSLLPKDKGDVLIDSLFHGPLYLWPNLSMLTFINKPLTDTVRLVLKACATHTPFDNVCSFSNGGLVGCRSSTISWYRSGAPRAGVAGELLQDHPI